jgi:LacI family transcriptional regulator
MKVTVHDIAAAAQVSVGTVSRALNGDPSVSPANAKRVLDTANSMNYRRLRRRPNRKASGALAGNRIGLILLGMDRALSSLPVVAAAIQGVEKAVAQAGGSLMLLSAPSVEWPQALSRERLDGLILKGALQGDLRQAADNKLADYFATLPCVWILGRPPGFCGDAIGTHDWRIGQMAADYLLAKGHCHVAYLNPKGDHLAFKVRELSFMDRMRSRGGTVVEAVRQPAERVQFPLLPVREENEVHDLVEQLIAASPRPTAVFVPADNIAALVYRSLSGMGMVVGRELSVISCNHESALTSALFPALTTIDVHAEQVGRLAVERLSERLRRKTSEQEVEILVEPNILEGGSVATISRQPKR